ncbi:putative Major capsid protein [Azospirillaceae bacterium]
MPNLSTLHINTALTDYAIALSNDTQQFMATKLCSTKRVKMPSGKITVLNREDAKGPALGSNQRMLSSLQGPKASAVEIEPTVTNVSYACHRYAYKIPVSDEELQISDKPLQPLRDAAKHIFNRLMIDQEILVSRLCCTAANYASGYQTTLTTGANGTSWNKTSAAGTGSDPLNNIRDARIKIEKNIMKQANTLAMSKRTMLHLADHDDLKSIYQYTDPNYIDRDGMHEHLKGLRVVTGDAVYDTAAEGASYTGDYIFGDLSQAAGSTDVAIVLYQQPGELGLYDFASFIMLLAPDATTGTYGLNLRSWRDDDRRAWMVEGSITCDIQPGIVDGSGLITGAYCYTATTV